VSYEKEVKMTKVGIVTDTVACLPPEKASEYDIRVVPFALNINGKTYLDQVDISPSGFWKMFKDIKELTTGAPGLGIFMEAFKDLSKSTKDIVCTFVSGKLSAMCEAATQAAALAKEKDPALNIEIVDSNTAAGAEGFIALEMARKAKEGGSIADVVKAGRHIAPRVKWLMGMETLKYLIRGGRAPKLAYAGELFGVKPIVGMVNNTGKVDNIDRARGKEKCLLKLVELVKKYVDTSRPIRVNIHYTDNIEDGKRLLNLVTSRYNCADVSLTNFTPVMCGHTGPVVALSFVGVTP
jgi:DegV family protein with EDD domain